MVMALGMRMANPNETPTSVMTQMIQNEMRWLLLMSSILANQDGLIKVMQKRSGVEMAWVWRVAGIAGLFLLIFEIFDRNMDPDFGWHLMTGRYILAHGVPAH